MRKLLIFLFVLFIGTSVFAKTYRAEVFKSDSVENRVTLETEDGISTPLENGEILLDEEDIITARGKGYIVIYLNDKTKIMLRNNSKKVKDIVN